MATFFIWISLASIWSSKHSRAAYWLMQLQLFVHSAQTRDLGKFVYSFARSCSWCALPAHCHTFARVVWPTDWLCGTTRILCITYTSRPSLTGDIVFFICACNVAHLHTSCVYVIVFVICRYASDRYRSIILTSIRHISVRSVTGLTNGNKTMLTWAQANTALCNVIIEGKRCALLVCWVHFGEGHLALHSNRAHHCTAPSPNHLLRRFAHSIE